MGGNETHVGICLMICNGGRRNTCGNVFMNCYGEGDETHVGRCLRMVMGGDETYVGRCVEL